MKAKLGYVVCVVRIWQVQISHVREQEESREYTYIRRTYCRFGCVWEQMGEWDDEILVFALSADNLAGVLVPI